MGHTTFEVHLYMPSASCCSCYCCCMLLRLLTINSHTATCTARPPHAPPCTAALPPTAADQPAPPDRQHALHPAAAVCLAPLQISLYDLNRVMAPGVAGAGIEPVMTFQEHKNLVTCLAPLGLHSPGTFVSGVEGGGGSGMHVCMHASMLACLCFRCPATPTY